MGLALVSALTVTGMGLINSAHGTPARSVAADSPCMDSGGNLVPVGTTAQGSDGHTYQCQSFYGIGIWVDMGPTDSLPGGGNPTHQPLQA
jgi:hypothetical protein